MKACISMVCGNKIALDFIDGRINIGIICASSKDDSQ